MLSIDVEDLDVSKDFNSIFIGAMAKQYLRDSDIIRTSEYKKKLLRAVRDFFIKCVKYLQASIPELKNNAIKSLTFFHQPERHQAMLDKWDVLMQGFLRFITEMNPFESEFLEYQATPDHKFPVYFDKDDKPIGIDHI